MSVESVRLSKLKKLLALAQRLEDDIAAYEKFIEENDIAAYCETDNLYVEPIIQELEDAIDTIEESDNA